MGLVHVAFLWHQHQPSYKDPQTGQYALPWARLHAIKDYWSMPLLVEAVEGLRVTINLVPSLVAQLDEYAAGTATDPWLELYRRPAEALSAEEAAFILDAFFSGCRRTMIDPHPRYRELHALRDLGHAAAEEALKRFSIEDLRDLQVWGLLAWFHPLAVERFEPVGALLRKDRGYTEADKEALLDVEAAILREVLPLHRRLAEAGVLELTTSPFYHPVLPLLVNMESAREAMPEVVLPRGHRPLVEDAREHLRRAVDLHTRTFGQPPTGMWPSEGAVSPDIIPLLAEAGVQWIATDEEVLAASLGRRLRSGTPGGDASVRYSAYRVAHAGAEVAVLFRDHVLSDLIGFDYPHRSAEAAADDFVKRLLDIGRAVPQEDGVVPIILDGENAWQNYPDQGAEFLRTLYARLAKTAGLSTVRISDFLAVHPPTARLERPAAGSWINHNFAIWVGDEEDRAAWERLFAAREFLARRTEEAGAHARDRDPFRTAWEEIYVTEGSDWYWWFGRDHSSEEDPLFDQLFRTHLKQVYRLLEAPPPPVLDVPIKSVAAPLTYTLPRSFQAVHIDGRDTTYFEWQDAGHYKVTTRYGAMRRSTGPMVTGLDFGFDAARLFLRVSGHGPMRQLAGPAPLVSVWFSRPRRLILHVAWRNGNGPLISASDPEGGPVASAGVEAALDKTLEVAVPFALLGAKPGDEVQFAVEVGNAQGLTERVPESGEIAFATPSPDFERMNWQV